LTPAGNRGKVETPQTGRRGGSTSSPGNLVPGAERNGSCFHTTTHLKHKFIFQEVMQSPNVYEDSLKKTDSPPKWKIGFYRYDLCLTEAAIFIIISA